MRDREQQKHTTIKQENRTNADTKTPTHRLMYAGSPWSVPAGHCANLDHVTEHYRKQAAAEEERKAKKLAQGGASPAVNLSQLYH
jgi:hypothetical protein